MTRRLPAPRREAQYVRGIGSLLALLAFIAGIPTLLVAVEARFWPDHIPSRAEVWDRLVSQDDGTILLGVLAAVAWIGWGIFTLIIATEIVGQLRGRQLPDLPGLAGPQQWAAALVAAVIVLLSSNTTAAPAAQATDRPPAPTLTHHHDQPSVERPHAPAGPGHPGRAAAPPADWTEHASGQDSRVDLPRYTVARHDTLWGIAERHLGEGTRWRDILALNPRLDDPDHLESGWLLVLPADATGLNPPPAAEGVGRVVTVAPGDTLWDLAQTHLGDGRRHTDLYAANAGRAQPDGGVLTDPDLIRPGWQLRIPGTADEPSPGGTGTPPTPPDSPPAPPIPDPPGTPPSAPTPAPSTPAPSTPASPAPSDQPTPTGAGERPGQHGQHGEDTPEPAEPTVPSEPAEDPDGGVRLPGGGLLALSVAGAVATALAVVRLRRRVHTSTAAPPDAGGDGEDGAADVVVEAAEPVAALSLEDAWHSAVSRSRVTDPDDEVEAADAARARAAVGVLAPVRGLSGIAIGPPRPVVQPELGTVPVGVDAEGRETRVALAAVGGLGVDGPGAAGVARAVLLALLSQGRGSAEVIVTRHAASSLFGEHADALDQVPGVRMEATMDTALGAAEEALVARGRLVDQTEAADFAAYRADPVLGQIPTTLLVTEPPDTDRRARRLRTVCGLGAGQDLTALLLGEWPDGVTCHVAADGTVTASTAGTDSPLGEGRLLFTAAAADTTRLIAEVLAEVRNALDYLHPVPRPPQAAPDDDTGDGDTAEQPPRTGDSDPDGAVPAQPAPATPAPGDGVATPPVPAGSGQDGHGGNRGRGAVLRLCVLGPQRLLTADNTAVLGRLAPMSAALLALLGCHRGGVSTDQIITALWPETTAARAEYARRVYPTVNRLRTGLAEITGIPGERLLTHHGGRYRLDPDTVDVDYWHLATALTAYRDSTDPDAQLAALRQVADLHTGDLLDGDDHQWAEPVRQALRGQVAAALAVLVDHLAVDNPAEAARLAERVTDIEPHVEEHYRRAMRLHAELGRPDPIRRLHRLLETRLTEVEATVSEETTRLVAYLHRQLHRPEAS